MASQRFQNHHLAVTRSQHHSRRPKPKVSAETDRRVAQSGQSAARKLGRGRWFKSICAYQLSTSVRCPSDQRLPGLPTPALAVKAFRNSPAANGCSPPTIPWRPVGDHASSNRIRTHRIHKALDAFSLLRRLQHLVGVRALVSIVIQRRHGDVVITFWQRYGMGRGGRIVQLHVVVVAA